MSKILCWLGIHRSTRTEPHMSIIWATEKTRGNRRNGTMVVCNDCDKIIEIHFTIGHTIRGPSILYLVVPIVCVLGFALVTILRFYLSGGG